LRLIHFIITVLAFFGLLFIVDKILGTDLLETLYDLITYIVKTVVKMAGGMNG